MEDRGHSNLVASDELAPEPQDTAVEFRDSQVSYPPLSWSAEATTRTLNAWVYITPNGAIDAMVMNGRVQK